MTKRRNPGTDERITAAAEIAGRALGQVAGTFDSLKAQHPHPVTEALEAGQEKLTALGSEAGVRATAVVKKTQAAAKKTRKVATRARRRSAKVIAAAARTTKKVLERAKKAGRRARKTVSRRAARFKP